MFNFIQSFIILIDNINIYIYIFTKQTFFKRWKMKKLLLAIFSIMMLSACQETPSLQGKTFALDTNKNFTIAFDSKEDAFYFC